MNTVISMKHLEMKEIIFNQIEKNWCTIHNLQSEMVYAPAGRILEIKGQIIGLRLKLKSLYNSANI